MGRRPFCSHRGLLKYNLFALETFKRSTNFQWGSPLGCLSDLSASGHQAPYVSAGSTRSGGCPTRRSYENADDILIVKPLHQQTNACICGEVCGDYLSSEGGPTPFVEGGLEGGCLRGGLRGHEGCPPFPGGSPATP